MEEKIQDEHRRNKRKYRSRKKQKKIEKNRKIAKKEQMRVFSEISEFVKKCGINFDIGL